MNGNSAAATFEEPLRIEVDGGRLIREIGSLFSSPEDAFAEMVQNAYRAGASKLSVHVKGNEVIFTDDGPGLTDPKLLFTIARTGWDESRVTDPAGMGAFALFALASKVRVVSVPSDGSPAWEAEFTEAAFQGDEIAIRGVDRIMPHGLQIIASLKPGSRLPELGGRKTLEGTTLPWRHRFPLTVTLVRDNGEPCVIAPTGLGPELGRVETAVGTFVVTNGRNEYNGSAVWEHRVLRVGADFTDAVMDRLSAHGVRGEAIRQAMNGNSFVWFVDEASRVRPQLPERSTLIRSAEYVEAARTIADALVETVDEQEILDLARAYAAEREVIREERRTHIATLQRCAIRVHLDLLRILPFLGYAKMTAAADFGSVETWVVRETDGAGFECSGVWETVYVKPRFRAVNGAVASTARGLGIAASEAGGSEDLPEIRFAYDEIVLSPATATIYATNLRLVSGEETIAPVTMITYTEYNSDDLAECFDDATAARIQADVEPRNTRRNEFFYAGIVPIGSRAEIPDLIRNDAGYLSYQLVSANDNSIVAEMCDFMDDDGINTTRFRHMLAEEYATELPEEEKSALARETGAGVVMQDLREARHAARWNLKEAAENIEKHGLNQGVLRRVQAALAEIEALAEITKKDLLA